jgi:hypothetical protein
MVRKLFALAALFAALGVAVSAPAPAIDFICSCTLCKPGSGLACRDLKNGGRFTSCGAYYASRCS